MGNNLSIYLTDYDLDEVVQHCGGKFSRSEVFSLYRRFRELDKGHKGFIASDELLNVPELSLNPLAKRIAHLFENVNFKEFVALLAVFSGDRCTQAEKLSFMFNVHDTDCDGVISKDDLEHMVRTLCGCHLNEDEVAATVKTVLAQACPDSADPREIDFDTFCKLFKDTNQSVDLHVEVPLLR
mmetsp:Transcript_17680/g.38568  ORF Transcript_17680/g.38568 Transcript_17680/m.38568 type:complete len:183 (-) Transcript_17680:149-697(-)|eukprot:CAMPEP_0118934430 /NCGR_PEP_ID=MMETSP1169-20130426/13821_1 /TAXON_ID=36882 /ORGANISM="Pyramimonas obovata, Strain CCMP722" /LENGTH=182 /DNA_ID=CAMNT_0006877333 /DNA_START=225 /DNA_END=773 /DNA_ORIENTATION=+